LHCLVQRSVPSPQVTLQPPDTHSPHCPSKIH
jgi:hypothetical protein